MSKRTKLKDLREHIIKIPQEMIVKNSDMRLRTYARAENGSKVQYSTALAILKLVNGKLVEQGKDPVQLDDLGLTIE